METKQVKLQCVGLLPRQQVLLKELKLKKQIKSISEFIRTSVDFYLFFYKHIIDFKDIVIPEFAEKKQKVEKEIIEIIPNVDKVKEYLDKHNLKIIGKA